MIRGPGEASPLARLVAEIWPALATAYLLVVYLAAFLDALAGRPAEGKGILSLLLLMALPIVDLFLSRALHAVMAARAETGAATAGKAPSGAATSYEPVVRKAIHIVVVVTGVLMLAGLWGIDFMRLAEARARRAIAGQLFGSASSCSSPISCGSLPRRWWRT